MPFQRANSTSFSCIQMCGIFKSMWHLCQMNHLLVPCRETQLLKMIVCHDYAFNPHILGNKGEIDQVQIRFQCYQDKSEHAYEFL